MAEYAGSEVGFEEEAMSWLPTHVIDEAYHPEEYLMRNKRHPQNSGRLLQNADPILLSQQNLKPSSRLQHRPRSHTTHWEVVGGPGMQAIFLDSSPRPCGTGVFLPHRPGANSRPTKKQVCSPVLLPSRVVQALNINVHELGLQIKSPPGKNNDSQSEDQKAIINNKKGKKDTSSKCCLISQTHSNSPEIFLPKEWTY